MQLKISLIIFLVFFLAGCTAVNDSKQPVDEPSEELDIVLEISDTIAEIKKDVNASNNSTINNSTPDDDRTNEEILLLKVKEEKLFDLIMNLEDGKTIDLYVWKTDINYLEYKRVLFALGFDEDIYGNEQLFRTEIVSKLEDPSDQDAINVIRDSYNSARLQAIRTVTVQESTLFLEDYSIPMEEVLYLSKYTPTIIITASKETILNFISDERVIGIAISENGVQQNQW